MSGQMEAVAIVLQCSGMGDCLFGIAVIRKLKAMMPSASFVLFTHHPGLFSNCPYVLKAFPLKEGEEPPELSSFSKCIRLFDTSKMPHYMVDTFDFMSIPAGIGELSFREKQLEYFPVEEDRSRPFDVVLNASMTWPSRSWSAENWQALADTLVKSGRSVAVVGKDVWSEADGMMKRSPRLEGCTDLTNQLSLDQTYYVIKNCGAFITCQNGLSVLAGATDTEILVLDMSIEWSKRAIYRQEDPHYKVTYIRGNCPEYCCQSMQCPIHGEFKCLPSVEQVLSAFQQIERGGPEVRRRVEAFPEAVPAIHGLLSPVRPVTSEVPALPQGGRSPRGKLCLVGLDLVARGARHIAILAPGGLPDILDGAALLAAFREGGRSRVKIFCPPECAGLLDGFDVQPMDPRRYGAGGEYREDLVRAISEFAPELVVNLDSGRSLEGDDLALAAAPLGGIAYELPPRGQTAELIQAANSAYSSLIPRDAGSDAMLSALGLQAGTPDLWPSTATRAEAKAVLQNLGWDPSQTLLLLVDHPEIPEGEAFKAALAAAGQAEWKFLGLGGRGTYRLLDELLDPLGDRGVNLAGVLSLPAMAALMQSCAGFLGGTPLLQSMARICGCVRLSAAWPE